MKQLEKKRIIIKVIDQNITVEQKKKIVAKIKKVLREELPLGTDYFEYMDILRMVAAAGPQFSELNELNIKQDGIYLDKDKVYSIEEIKLLAEKEGTKQKDGFFQINLTISVN